MYRTSQYILLEFTRTYFHLNFIQAVFHHNNYWKMPRSSRPRSPTGGRTAFTATRPTTMQTTSQPGILSGIGSTIAQGMAFGAGSEVAHQAIRSVTGSHQTYYQPQQTSTQQNPCQSEINSFSDCLGHNSNISNCQTYSESLKDCKMKYNVWFVWCFKLLIIGNS